MSQDSEFIPICIIHFTVYMKYTGEHNMTVHHMNPEALQLRAAPSAESTAHSISTLSKSFMAAESLWL